MRIDFERDHYVESTFYDDETLERIPVRLTLAKPGYQLNGHRTDCRCESCRPDIVRLPS